MCHLPKYLGVLGSSEKLSIDGEKIISKGSAFTRSIIGGDAQARARAGNVSDLILGPPPPFAFFVLAG